jgi:hypothetical protein
MPCPTSELSGNLPGSLTVSLSLFTLCCHLNLPTIRAFLGSFLIDQSLGAIRYGFGQQSLHANAAYEGFFVRNTRPRTRMQVSHPLFDSKVRLDRGCRGIRLNLMRAVPRHPVFLHKRDTSRGHRRGNEESISRYCITCRKFTCQLDEPWGGRWPASFQDY